MAHAQGQALTGMRLIKLLASANAQAPRNSDAVKVRYRFYSYGECMLIL